MANALVVNTGKIIEANKEDIANAKRMALRSYDRPFAFDA
jgi:Gamma-glutamyl phosphate reductase